MGRTVAWKSAMGVAPERFSKNPSKYFKTNCKNFPNINFRKIEIKLLLFEKISNKATFLTPFQANFFFKLKTNIIMKFTL